MKLQCIHPIEIFRFNGEYSIKPVVGIAPIKVDCGKCISCQTKYKMHLGIRAVHEDIYSESGMFLTLTVDDEHIETLFPEGSLVHRPFQLFVKRLRDRIKPVRIKYVMCGEYGEQGNRPHYHCIIFGYRFKDMYCWKRGKNPLYRSPMLESLWPYGFSTVGKVTQQSASYLGKYVVKGRAKKDYNYIDLDTGVLRKKEYIVYPNSGLGKRYYLDHKVEMFTRGYLVLKGNIKCGIPKYYKRLLSNSEDPADVKLWEDFKMRMSKLDRKEATREELLLREEIELAREEFMKRR